MVVVFPAPLTPMTSITDGFVPSLSEQSPETISATISRSIARASPASCAPFSRTRRRSSSQMRIEVSPPTSESTSVSSSSSSRSLSIFL